ncbi:MAG: hypothetical protein AAF726_19035 [Planctomycetota bacterium]
MRALLGLLILGSLFVMAASWQNRTTSELRERRERRYGIPSDSVAVPEGWGRLVLGRPSGAEPIPAPEPPPAEALLPAADVAPPDEGAPPPTYAPDFEYTVQPTDVLGEICQRFYEVRPLAKVIEAVATYNDLDDANSIRAGDVLLLPDPEVLFGQR